MIGQARDRVDGRPKVTGDARFAAENNLPGLVHAVVVMATIPAGTMKSLDLAAAKKAPGVLTILSHLNPPKTHLPGSAGGGNSETGGKTATPSGGGAAPGGNPSGNYAEPRAVPFASATIHYVGQQIAVVIADTLEHATHAASLVKVTYNVKAARTDMHALRGEAVTKPSGPQNEPFTKGNPQAAFEAAAVKIDQVYRSPYQHHNPLEAHAIVAVWDGDKLTLHDSAQNIFATRQMLARAFAIPTENVRVLSPYVGGAFGSKGSAWPHLLIGVMAAKVVNKPVKLWMPRRQLFFTTGHRPETEQRVALGATQDGKLVSIIHDAICQGNAINDFNERATRPTRTLYATPNLYAAHKVVELNVASGTYMRAPGENPGCFALESALDELAYSLRMDPIELRTINHADVNPSDGKPWSSKSLKECYTRGAERFGWSRRNREPRSMREGRLLIGYGTATATYPAHRSPASARAVMHDDGTVIVSSGSHEMGTGTATVMAQVAAEVLGLPAERVRFLYGDTTLPTAPISAGSMTASSVGSAVFEVATALKKKLVELAEGERVEDYAALLHRHYLPSITVRVDSKPEEAAQKYSMHAFGAHFAEVAVDVDLGIVSVRRMVSAFAAGRILNAKTARSQYLGGIVQGISAALMEQTHFDKRAGSFTNVNFGEYLIPVNADIRNLDVIFVEETDLHVNPIGAKGIGEVGIVGVTPAIANAVFHATGKRIRDLPITIEKLL
ncbi:MAG TPA: xanthine dehydrogenase family protein molybdopterin-binding subunit [Thermoanaerobaculia bacterium]|nr:xanthine dehydrogenase family protein molybdopterin-binding subunit [Thermoanaerobaculia bacterium]